MEKAANIDEYISSYPQEIQKLLQQVRETIHKAIPGAKEVISYSMPAFSQNGIVVYFAAHKNHIGFYPTASGMRTFEKEFSGYKTSKGAVQLPFSQPIPLKLIAEVAQFRLKENLAKPVKKKRS